MSATIEMLEVSGLKEALKQIGKLDKSLRRELTKDFERAASPMVDAIRTAVPTSPPLSGFATKSRMQWKRNETKSVKVKVDTRRAKYRNENSGAEWSNVGTVKITTTTAALAIFDIAGTAGSGKSPQGEALIAGLQRRFGNPSRIMWPNAERKWQEVEGNLEQVIKRVQDELTRLLKEN